MKKEKLMKGFSLIELLVVIGIIAILTGLVAFNFNSARMRARDVQRKSDLRELRSALELYKNDNNQQYPSSDDYGSLIIELNAGGYIQQDLKDPKIAQTGDTGSWEEYTYTLINPALYQITMCFENKADDTLPSTAASCGVPAKAGLVYTYSSQ